MKYSIFIPTYNSMRWIQSSIGSVMAQTHKEFEIIVVDSGSSDGTVEWIKSLNDEKIRIYESAIKLDIVQNWSRFTKIPKGKYMTIMGHDDILYPEYLTTIEKLVDTYPDADLYQTHFNFIDGKGDFIRKCAPMKNIYSPAELIENILQNRIEITATGFMMHSDKYDGIGGVPDYPNLLYADTELWIQLILDSRLVVAEQTCFEFRFHIENTSKSAGNIRLVAFEKMVNFFNVLKNDYPEYRAIIEDNAKGFLKNYAVGSCHKLIYVPKANRDHVTMDKIAVSAKKCAQKLIPGIKFEPERFPGLRLAKMIDSNVILQKLFLFYKSLKKRTF